MKQNTNKVIDTDNPELTAKDFKGMRPISELLTKLSKDNKTANPSKTPQRHLQTA